jgi:triacylglycerol lipase
MGFPTTSGTIRPFAAGVTDYNSDIAWWLAQCSRLAYESKPAIAAALRNAGFTDVTFFNMRGTQAYLAKHPGIRPNRSFAVLAFRGTQNDYADIVTDISFLKRPIPDDNIRAHGGFVTALQDILGTSLRDHMPGGIKATWLGAEGLTNALDALPEDLPRYFTGHSLGGALATLAAVKRRPTAVYTFGSPRVGGRGFVTYIDSSGIASYRVVNSTDIITRLPLPFRYRHVNLMIYMTRGGQVLYPPSRRIRLIKCLEFLREIFSLFTLFPPLSLFARQLNPRFFTNHRIGEYVRKLS